jgi:hypothetical protein
MTCRAETGQSMVAGGHSGPERPKALVAYFNFLAEHNLTDSKASATFYQVHEDLRLIRGWTNMRVVQGPRLHLLGCAAPGFDSVFPNAADSGVDRTQAVVPMSVDTSLTPRILSDMCAAVAHPSNGPAKRCVTAAIVDVDSTTAYYRIFDSFEEIVHPQWKQKKARASGDGDEEDGVADIDDSASDSGASSSAGVNSD